MIFVSRSLKISDVYLQKNSFALKQMVEIKVTIVAILIDFFFLFSVGALHINVFW